MDQPHSPSMLLCAVLPAATSESRQHLNTTLQLLITPCIVKPMPKSSLEFSLPEEKRELKLALNSGEIYSCLWEVDQYCRGILKHGDPSQEIREHLENIRRIILESEALIE